MAAMIALRGARHFVTNANAKLGKVTRLVKDGALVKLRDSDEKVEVPHPSKPSPRLMIHDDVELVHSDSAGWTATVFEDPTGTKGVPRSRAGRSHLDDLAGAGGTKNGLLSDLHGWRNKKR
jgi:hypothetical protein